MAKIYWDESLHPRDRKGRFIRKFGIIKFLDAITGVWSYGEAAGAKKSGGKDVLTVIPVKNLKGEKKPGADPIELSPSKVYVAATPKAHLSIAAPGAEKVGPQGGSNTGGLYSIPSVDKPATPTLVAKGKEVDPKVKDLYETPITDGVPTTVSVNGVSITKISDDYYMMKSEVGGTLTLESPDAIGIMRAMDYPFPGEGDTEPFHGARSPKVADAWEHPKTGEKRFYINNWRSFMPGISADYKGKAWFGEDGVLNIDKYQGPDSLSTAKTRVEEALEDYGLMPGEGGEVPDAEQVPEVPTAENFYVKKAQTPAHGKNEALANALYAEAGVHVPEVDYNSEDGNIYSKIINGEADMPTKMKDPAWLKEIHDDFAIDAWLGNWDVFGMHYDNLLTDSETGAPVRIDNGGALLFRAMGQPKGSDFGSKVGELDQFKAAGKKKAIYSSMTKESELDGAQRVLAITPDKIEELVAEHGLQKSLADTLKARRKFIADYYGLPLPETMQPAGAPEQTSAPLVDPLDAIKAKGLSREWTQGYDSLFQLSAMAEQGDLIKTATGVHTLGRVEGVAGQSINNQLAALMSEGGPFHIKKSFKAERPGHGDVHSASNGMGLLDVKWERGDRIELNGKLLDVEGVNRTYGTLLVSEPGSADTFPLLPSNLPGQVKVLRWDPPVLPDEPKPEPAVKTGLAADIEKKVKADLVTPLPDNGPPAPPKPVEKTDGIGPASTKGNVKSMQLGDATTAATGDKVTSKINGAEYIFVKPKGPYAVVTDPNSDDPEKHWLKKASTLTQPGKAASEWELDLMDGPPKPKSKNGIMPEVGMVAKAKDGTEGPITMVSPDGKFVFIDGGGPKPKRKSTGAVDILEAGDQAEVAETPVVPAGTPSVGSPGLPGHEYGKYVSKTKPPHLPETYKTLDELTGQDIVFTVDPEGNILSEKWANQPAESLVPMGGIALKPGGKVAVAHEKLGDDILQFGVSELPDLPGGEGYYLLYNGEGYEHKAEWGTGVVWKDDAFHKLPEGATVLASMLEESSMLSYGESAEGADVEEVSEPAGSAPEVGEFKTLKQLKNEGKLLIGSHITPDGKSWYVVDDIWGDGTVQVKINEDMDGSFYSASFNMDSSFVTFAVSNPETAYNTPNTEVEVEFTLKPGDDDDDAATPESFGIWVTSAGTGPNHQTLHDAFQSLTPEQAKAIKKETLDHPEEPIFLQQGGGHFYKVSEGVYKLFEKDTNEWHLVSNATLEELGLEKNSVGDLGHPMIYPGMATIDPDKGGDVPTFVDGQDKSFTPEPGDKVAYVLPYAEASEPYGVFVRYYVQKPGSDLWFNASSPGQAGHTWEQLQEKWLYASIAWDGAEPTVEPAPAADEVTVLGKSYPTGTQVLGVTYNGKPLQTFYVKTPGSQVWIAKTEGYGDGLDYTDEELAGSLGTGYQFTGDVGVLSGDDEPKPFKGSTSIDQTVYHNPTLGVAAIKQDDGTWEVHNEAFKTSTKITEEEAAGLVNSSYFSLVQGEPFIASEVVSLPDPKYMTTSQIPEGTGATHEYFLTDGSNLSVGAADMINKIGVPAGYAVYQNYSNVIYKDAQGKQYTVSGSGLYKMSTDTLPTAAKLVDINNPNIKVEGIPTKGSKTLPLPEAMDVYNVGALKHGDIVMSTDGADGKNTYMQVAETPDGWMATATWKVDSVSNKVLSESAGFTPLPEYLVNNPFTFTHMFSPAKLDDADDPTSIAGWKNFTLGWEDGSVKTNLVPGDIVKMGTTLNYFKISEVDNTYEEANLAEIWDKTANQWIAYDGEFSFSALKEIGTQVFTPSEAVPQAQDAPETPSALFGQDLPEIATGYEAPFATTNITDNVQPGDIVVQKLSHGYQIAYSVHSVSGGVATYKGFWTKSETTLGWGDFHSLGNPVNITIPAGSQHVVFKKTAAAGYTPKLEDFKKTVTVTTLAKHVNEGDYIYSGGTYWKAAGPVYAPGPKFGSVPVSEKWNPSTEEWETPAGSHLQLSNWYGDTPFHYLKAEKVAAKGPAAPQPFVPSMPDDGEDEGTPGTPGVDLPTAAQKAAWGGDLTKDGYIPSPGMHVTGKGPMTGKIVSVNADKTKAVVLTDEGKKTTRLISALASNKSANYAEKLGPVVPKEIPEGMTLPTNSPSDAFNKVFGAKGAMAALVNGHEGIRNGETNVIAVTAPSGKKYARVNFTLTKEQRAKLSQMLASGPTEDVKLGGWDTSATTKSDDVAPGMKLAMRLSSDGAKWKVNNGTQGYEPPTHEVVSVAPWVDGKATVTLKNIDTGEEITSSFHAGKYIDTKEWDPNKAPLPTAYKANSLQISQPNLDKGWKKLSGSDGVTSAVKGGLGGELYAEPGEVVPTFKSAYLSVDHAESNAARLVNADGTVIEVTNLSTADNTYSGVVTLSIPEGGDPVAAYSAAMAALGMEHAPHTQEATKRNVRPLLRILAHGGKDDLDTPGSYSDDALFKKIGSDLGLTDVGWHDVEVGVDESIGKVSYFWSPRVRDALTKKAPTSLVLRAASTANADAIVSTVKGGTANAVTKRLTGMVDAASGKGLGASASSDAANNAGHGGFVSAQSVAPGGKLPTSNSLAGYKSAHMMVYHRPEAVYGRIADYRVSASSDAFGAGSSNNLGTIVKSSSIKDFWVGGGLPPESVSMIAVQNASERKKAIEALKAQGITVVNGVPVEDFIVLLSDGKKLADLPPYVNPTQTVPLTDLP